MADTSLPGLTIRVHPAELLLSWPHSHPTQRASPLKQKDQPIGFLAGTEPPLDFVFSQIFPHSHQQPSWHAPQHILPHPSHPNLPNTGRKSHFCCLMQCGQHACLPCGPRLNCSLAPNCCHHCGCLVASVTVGHSPHCFKAPESCIPQDKLQVERGGSSQPSVAAGN